MHVTPWNQKAWCSVSKGNEAGVCRALVLLWLFLGGETAPPNPTDPRGSTYAAVLQQVMGANIATFGANVLNMRWKGPQEMLPKILPAANVVDYVFEMNAWPARLLIGIGTEDAGHAIGVALSLNRCYFFDPNTGYGSGDPQDVIGHAMASMLVYAKRHGAQEISLYRFWV